MGTRVFFNEGKRRCCRSNLDSKLHQQPQRRMEKRVSKPQAGWKVSRRREYKKLLSHKERKEEMKTGNEELTESGNCGFPNPKNMAIT